jgi:hypothetical protein
MSFTTVDAIRSDSSSVRPLMGVMSSVQPVVVRRLGDVEGLDLVEVGARDGALGLLQLPPNHRLERGVVEGHRRVLRTGPRPLLSQRGRVGVVGGGGSGGRRLGDRRGKRGTRVRARIGGRGGFVVARGQEGGQDEEG